mmetsp:Transcript_21441/g.52345  ORF Transcript_21441/g.52345 Transcript_21441/m.52345 type:complete len:140 (-) Transcript_21441:25-444(-)|eukprot:CAMPEP_0198317188 /NCGR_PEP_ID=MMETSP1450-20131203/6759_1 /TAXON_ID=753684 ORGANISM="Madagascaria erythrocladiodes, Strain CCMP3234" /NCGR_SAMPLE_ID=MMETSP1450 /ASSEMBLY_ACC=CAM_ASM_001115 /LENGTH=139 /DNA_ID=CAMNT_0044020375 /DNA_START=96 /DNA_END=515 /DNA_ORIENTATION=+
MRVKGQCLCGDVKIEATPEAAALSACHCGMCRKWTSGAYIGFPADPKTLKAHGPVKTKVTSEWAERSFCGECGSVLWYRLTAAGKYQGYVEVAAGLFDDACGLELKKETYIDKKPTGYHFADKTETLTEAQVEELFAAM